MVKKHVQPIDEDIQLAAVIATIVSGGVFVAKGATIAALTKSAAAAAGAAVGTPALTIGGVILATIPIIQCSYRAAESPEARDTRRQKRKQELQ